MKEKRLEGMVSYIKGNYRFLTILFSILFIIFSYFLMKTITHNHLSYSHLMYIPIVLTGSILGGYYGLGIGIIAGLAVGPLMPYNLDTLASQYWLDWVFRLMMMSVIGYMSGMFGMTYRSAQKRIKDILERNQDTGLHNINYLMNYPLEKNRTYTVASLIIGNSDLICDVVGYEAYFEYIQNIDYLFKSKYIDIRIIQTDLNHLWFIKPTYDFDEEIVEFISLIGVAHILGQQSLFVDYAVGFSKQKNIQEKDITKYFIQSDMAAREAKATNLVYLTYSDVNTKKQFEYELLTDFYDAMRDGQIYLVYQPKIDLKTKRPIGLEALIRWNHHTKKTIMPDQFIHAVENTNMIHEMTQMVFRWSLDYQKKLIEHGVSVPISINISTKNLYDIHFYDKMVAIFKEYQIKPSFVEFEITETVLMEDPENSKKMLEAFSNYGFKIAIDDFGKGYSSLAYLAQFPINTIKIDRFFTKQILINPTTQHIVKATIDLAKQLGYQVLIEGIEDKETADLLERLGCHTAQGYLYLRPQKEEEILSYLKEDIDQ
ncbi:MAG: EAL domain-containing protein [Acholeplasmataceae bacterium]|nr:EAL domain-containing protein [Acholeplasmataceae bacterium]